MDLNEKLESLYIYSKLLLIKDSRVSYTDLCCTCTELPLAPSDKIMLSRNVLSIKPTDQHIKTSLDCSKLDNSNSFAIYQI